MSMEMNAVGGRFLKRDNASPRSTSLENTYVSVQRRIIELPGTSAKSDKRKMMRMKGNMKIAIIVTARDATHQRFCVV